MTDREMIMNNYWMVFLQYMKSSPEAPKALQYMDLDTIFWIWYVDHILPEPKND